MNHVKSIESSLKKLKSEVENLESHNKELETYFIELLNEPSIIALPNYKILELKYKQLLKLLVTDNKNKKKKQSEVSETYVNSIFAPRWARGANDTLKNHIYEQEMVAKKTVNISKKVPLAANANANVNVKVNLIDPGEDMVSKINVNGINYLNYKNNIFDLKGNHVGTIGNKIIINETEVMINRTVIDLILEDDGYYKDKSNNLYKIVGNLAKKVGTLNNDEMEVFE